MGSWGLSVVLNPQIPEYLRSSITACGYRRSFAVHPCRPSAVERIITLMVGCSTHSPNFTDDTKGEGQPQVPLRAA